MRMQETEVGIMTRTIAVALLFFLPLTLALAGCTGEDTTTPAAIAEESTEPPTTPSAGRGLPCKGRAGCHCFPNLR